MTVAETAVDARALHARVDADARVRAAIGRLALLGPVSAILLEAAADAASAAALDRVVLSRVDNGALIAERVHVRAGPAAGEATLAALRSKPLALEYPLLECELLRRRRAQLAVVDRADPHRGRHAFLETLDWSEYVAAPIVIDAQVVGFLHGDREPGGAVLGELEVDALEHFAAGFALVFERAVLRRRLRDQQREIRQIATWADVRSSEHSNAAIDLAIDGATEEEPPGSAPEVLTDEAGAAHLTAREVDVLKLMADGKTNADIARTLVVSQGTVKFHVKNILRKMQASNRADATSRYLRMSLRPQRPSHR